MIVTQTPQLALAAALLSFAAPFAARAQDAVPACQWQGSQQWLSTRPSPLDSAVLTLPGLTAKVCYSRPSARGRVVFDSLLPMGKAWRTGANEPTTLRLSAPASVAGVRLPAGRYVVMTVPRADNWLVLFYTTEETEPGAMFRSLTEAGRGLGTVERLDAPVDTFTIRARDSQSGAELHLEWERVRVHVPIIPRS